MTRSHKRMMGECLISSIGTRGLVPALIRELSIEIMF